MNYLMNPMREITWHERQFVAFVAGGLPACVIGFVLGLWGEGIGGADLDVGVVLWRGFYCALFPSLLAWLMPRSWIPMALTYMLGFSMGFGFHFADGFVGLEDVFAALAYWADGTRIIKATPPSHDDLPWILAVAFWLAGLAALLRRSTRFAAFLRRLEIRE
jgi:hypothetical protein